MRVAVIGTGISGLSAARDLFPRYDITVFEASDRVGGHAHTHDVEVAGQRHRVDTGFMVFNRKTYPGFSKMLDDLGIGTRPTEMSFSVRCDRSGLEYCGTNLNTLFAQRRNLLRLRFHRMLIEILRFNRIATAWLDSGPDSGPDDTTTLACFLREHDFADDVVARYILPMGAAIWSAPPDRMRDFPAHSFLRFFHNHGLLTVDDQPQWYTVRGGSRTYVDRLIAPFRERIRRSCPVRRITRRGTGVEVRADGYGVETFDRVVIAVHADEALAMHPEADADERRALSSISFQRNELVLHTDARLLPRARRAWASWNYRTPLSGDDPVAVTYYLNRLQGVDCPEPLCATLNRSDDVRPEKILREIVYTHPLYNAESLRGRRRLGEVDGRGGVYYCGAYRGLGFHEDGFASGLAAARAIGERRAAA